MVVVVVAAAAAVFLSQCHCVRLDSMAIDSSIRTVIVAISIS